MSLENGSASGNARLLVCPSSLALPRVNRSSEHADRGHGIHAYIRAVASGTSVDVAMGKLAEEHRQTCLSIDWEKLCGDLDGIESEVAYAIDVRSRTARMLGRNIGRDYEGAAVRSGSTLGEWEIPGSLDLTGRSRRNGRRVVVDVKSGFQDVEPAETNAQLLFFAAVFHLLDGDPEIDCRIAKLKPSGNVWNDAATFDAWTIDDHLDELEAAIERSKQAKRVYLAGGVPDFNEGEHCDYCHGSDACPSKNKLARSMLGDLHGLDGAIEAMPDADAGRAYETVHDRIMPLAERILEGLKTRARTKPLPLSGDTELREAPFEKESPDFQAAVALARELGATDAQVKACYRSIVVRPVRPCKLSGAAVAKRSRGRKEASP